MPSGIGAVTGKGYGPSRKVACSPCLTAIAVPHCDKTLRAGRNYTRGDVQDRLTQRRPGAPGPGGSMGLTTEHDGPGTPGRPVAGYETVPLLVAGTMGGAGRGGAAVLRRRTARPSRRAVVYVHCLGDSFVPADLVGWYTDRGFHFYAADLRAVGGRAGGAGAERAGRGAERLLRLPGRRRHAPACGRCHRHRGGFRARGRRPLRRAVVPRPAGQPAHGRAHPRQPRAGRRAAVAGPGGGRA